ncbi:probable U3 small nucleolar RNA-associated protein 11 [Trichonephila inaurata madagascariensis]|uniref:U3 small nucleolar RNA-associated protein 11 n=1 Tax=Trichonephila inaurata madagascariensis TaxID=2747483 RepID=A0A8X7CMM9_9ARAC|nr:probable U3 small nucleolar RNA-associated protein 11 [Trichonephila inaurata madagascariensis]
MSSFMKIAKTGRREFKERHQPEFRREFGFLEKKKDYKLRARDHKVKKNKLRKLYRKAMFKNPNEFYYHMINSEIKDGLHYEKEKVEEHSEAQKKLMQTQDSNYINYKLTTELKKIEKLQCSVAVLNVEDRPKNTHTFYLDSKKEAKKLDIAKKLNTHPALLGRTFNRPTLDSLKNMKLQDCLDEEMIIKSSSQITSKYNELSKRIERAQELKVLSQKLDVKKKLLNKKESEPKLLKPATKANAPVYVWNKERKR